MTMHRPNLRPLHRWGTALVAVAVLANLACVCRVAAAASNPAGKPAAVRPEAKRACCSRAEPAPREDAGHPPTREGGDCPHCGTKALTLERPAQPDATKLDPAGGGSFADAALVAALPCLSDDGSGSSPATDPRLFPPPPTLLGLHCALNW